MRQTRRKDGSLLIEDHARNIRWMWIHAAPEEKVILDEDRRPAIRKPNQLGDTCYYTFHPAVWDSLKRRLRLVEAWDTPSRTKLCGACGREMRVQREYGAVWVMRCETCTSIELLSKDLYGGTQGAGDKEPKPSGKREL